MLNDDEEVEAIVYVGGLLSFVSKEVTSSVAST